MLIIITWLVCNNTSYTGAEGTWYGINVSLITVLLICYKYCWNIARHVCLWYMLLWMDTVHICKMIVRMRCCFFCLLTFDPAEGLFRILNNLSFHFLFHLWTDIFVVFKDSLHAFLSLHQYSRQQMLSLITIFSTNHVHHICRTSSFKWKQFKRACLLIWSYANLLLCNYEWHLLFMQSIFHEICP